jgi:phosphatidylglycerol:prolipoprotein diacylglycerol transferase
MTIFNFILWDVSPEWFSIGPLTIRWYGLLFALGFLIGQQILIRIYKGEGKSEKHVETLTVYMVLSTIIGARLGHCLFYQPDYYLSNPIEILKIWEGGLASHGATIGILIAIYIYSKKATDQSYFYVLDRLVITVALAGCLIRLGNLMNSEIIGKPTDISTAFLFVNDTKKAIEKPSKKYIENVEIKQNGLNIKSESGIEYAGIDIKIDFKKNKITRENISRFIQNQLRDSIRRYSDEENVVMPMNLTEQVTTNANGTYSSTIQAYAIPRHPSQLYESISCFFLFLLLLYIYSRKKGNTPEGRLFGLFVIVIFTLRFIYEFQKENQVAAETQIIDTIGMNLGQLLSIPFILFGLFVLMRSFRKKNEVI